MTIEERRLRAALIVYEGKKLDTFEELVKDRLDGKTDDDIETIRYKVREKVRFPQIKKWIDSVVFAPEEYSRHDPHTPFGFDILSVTGDMRTLPYEECRILMFDKNNKYLGYRSVTNHGMYSVNASDIGNAFKKLYKRTAKVVMIHNHPYFGAAYPSENDDRVSRIHRDMLEVLLKVERIDDCIITWDDFWSREADEKASKAKKKR